MCKHLTAQNAGTFRTHLREFFSHGKPVAVTEYGTCAYRGAGDLGGAADQPQAPAELRDALHAINRHVDDYITRARLGRAA